MVFSALVIKSEKKWSVRNLRWSPSLPPALRVSSVPSSCLADLSNLYVKTCRDRNFIFFPNGPLQSFTLLIIRNGYTAAV